MIESLGGIEDTVKPLEASLKAHELRPYDYMINYKEEIRNLSRDPANASGTSGRKGRSLSIKSAENAKIVSASPYRAIVQLATKTNDGSGSDEDSDDEFARETRSSKAKRQSSPIKDDSEMMRTSRDGQLNAFTLRRKNSISQTVRSELPPQLDNHENNLLRGIMASSPSPTPDHLQQYA